MSEHTVEILYQDGSDEVYQCSPTGCGYNGDTYCQNCGFDKNGN